MNSPSTLHSVAARAAWLVGLILLLLGAAASAGESVWTDFQHGVAAYNRGDLETAGKIFRAVEKDPRVKDAHYYLGAIQLQDGDLGAAEKELGKVGEHCATYALAQEGLGEVSLKKKDFEKAAAHFATAAKLHPSLEAWMQVATVDLEGKKYDEAEKSLGEAKQFAPKDLQLLSLYGRLYLETKKYEKALDCFSRLSKKWPSDSSMRVLVAFCLDKVGRTADSLEEYRGILKLDPWCKTALRALVKADKGDRTKKDEYKALCARLKKAETDPPPVAPRPPLPPQVAQSTPGSAAPAK